ncbi:MAG: hypothetical protein PGN25_20545 [Methylorubrum populi]
MALRQSGNKNDVRHLGLAGSDRFSRRLADTRAIRDATAIGRVGVEAAWQRDPFRRQGADILTDVEHRRCGHLHRPGAALLPGVRGG